MTPCPVNGGYCEDHETWIPVAGFPGYEVSDHGRVRSWRPHTRLLEVPRLLTGGSNPHGYRMVCLRVEGGRQKSPTIHRLVAAAFLGPRPAPPVGASRIEVCHRDGDQTNNHASNLRYGTPKQNAADSIAHGTHTSVVQKARTHCKRGHEFTPENTYMGTTSKGHLVRNCRKCVALKQRQYAARKKAVAPSE